VIALATIGKALFPIGQPLFPLLGQEPDWRISFCSGTKTKWKNVKTLQVQKARVMRAARGRLGLTQFDLARRVQCSESQIAKIETGRATPEEWLKEAIARELRIAAWEVGV
jgi:ribosome-binding protein aMBF1 (putative translation factor)